MARLRFTPNLLRHVATPEEEISGATIGAALQAYFAAHPEVRSYVLDEQGAIRKHIAVFLNQQMVPARQAMAAPLEESDELFIAQALSGG